MPTIRGNTTFNAESTSNNKVSKDDGKLNLSFVKEATSIIENTGSDVNNNKKEQLVSSVFENQLGQGEKKKINVQGFSHLVTGERMAAQRDPGCVPSVGLSQATEVLDADKVNSLKEAFQNNLRRFEASNPRQWLAINNHAPLMESIVEETNNDHKIFESETEKYVIRLDYNLTTQTYTFNKGGSANPDDIETTMFLVVDKYVKDENGKWVYSTSSLANEVVTEFPVKGDFTTTINDKELYIGTIEASVNDPRNKDINGLDMTKVNFDQKWLTGVKSGNTIGEAALPKDYYYKQINGDIFGPGVDMSNRVLKDINLSGVNLNRANFINTKFINVTSGRISGQPYLSDDYKLINRYIVGPHVNLENARLRDADLSNINISGAKLSGANLTGITSYNVTYDENTTLPDNCKIVNGYIIGPNVILQNNRDFRSIDFNGVSFFNVDVKSADFRGADLTGTILENADFSNANLSGIRSGNIEGGNMIKNTLVKLPQHYIFYNGYILGPGVNLHDVDLTEFDFSLLTFYNLKLTNIIGTPILPSGYVMRGGFVVGKYMDFSNEDLSQLDFSGLDLSYSIFTGANISLLNLIDTKMTDVISGNMPQVPFIRNEYTYKIVNGYLIGPGTIFNGIQLTSVDLKGVKFNGSQGLNIIGVPKLPNEYKVINQNIVGPDVNLTGANFKFSDLSEANLRGVKSGQVLTNEQILLPENYTIINGYIIGKDVILTGADFSNADLSNTILEGVVSGGVQTNNNTKFPSGYKVINGYIVGKDVNLTGANLKGVDLKDVDLTNANLQNADLTNANLQNADLTDALLEGVVSGGVNTNDSTKFPSGYKVINGYIVGKGVNLTGANLNGADLKNMDLTNANLQNADLSNADLSNAQLEGVISGDVKINNSTKLPSGYKVINGYIVGKGVNLTNVNDNLQSADLTNLNISGADLSNVDLSNAILKMVITGNIKININTKFPTGYREANGHIVGKDVDLRNGRLINVNLSDIDLSESLLTGVSSENVYIDNTKFPEGYTIIGGYVLNKNGVAAGEDEYTDRTSLPDGFTVRGGYIFGKDVSFENVTLSNIDLSNMDLSSAIFKRCKSNNVIANNTKLPNGYTVRNGFILGHDVDLTDADLTNINIESLNLKNAILNGVKSENVQFNYNTSLPVGYKAINGYILGPNVNLYKMKLTVELYKHYGVNLSGANFEEADFEGSRFDYVEFVGTNFKNAKLNNVLFTNGNFENVDMSGAKCFKLQMDDCIFDNAILTGVDGECMVMDGIIFKNTDLSNSNLKSLRVANSDFRQAILNGCDFSKSSFDGRNEGSKVETFGSDFDKCDFSGLDLGGLNIQRASISECNLQNCYLVDANLKDLVSSEKNNFSGSFLSGADLRGAEITYSNFNECELSYVNLTNAIVYSSTWRNSKLNFAILVNTKIYAYDVNDNVDFTDADLSDANLTDLYWRYEGTITLTGIKISSDTIGPNGKKPWNGKLEKPGPVRIIY